MFDTIAKDRRALLFLSVVGLGGPILMYLGDMAMYFASVTSADFEQQMVDIMRARPFSSVVVGGFVGPIAAVGYAAAYLALASLTKLTTNWKILLFLIWIIAISIGGAYHSQFPHMMFSIDILGHEGATYMEKLPEGQAQYLTVFLASYLLLKTAGWFWFTVLVAIGKTELPRWFAVLTPVLLFFGGSFAQRLPEPANILIAGGWFNLMYLPIFAALTFWVMRRRVL